MHYILGGIGIAYGALSAFAATVQWKKAERKDTSLMMLGGGLLFVIGACLYIAASSYGWIAAAAGGALICVAAFLNGKRGEAFHISHHVIRLAVTVLLVAAFWLT